MFLNKLVKAGTLSPEYQDGARSEVGFCIGSEGALIEAVNPKAGSLEVFEGAADVGHPGHREVLERAGRGSCHGFGERGGPAFRDDNSIGSDGVRGADDCTQIVGILDTIEDNQ